MKNRVYKNVIWFGLAAVLIFSPLAKGAVEIWSITPVELTVAILVFLWLWRENNRKEKKERFKRTAIDLPLWLFIGLAVVSCLFSSYKYAGFFGLLRLMTVVGVFYLVLNNFGSQMTVRLVTLLIIMGASLSLFGLGQYFCGLEHSWWFSRLFLAATYVNHNHFAGYLEMAIPLSICMLIGLKRDELSSDFQFLSFRAALFAAFLIMFTALIFSQSRGAWICLTISLIVLNIVLIKRKVLRKQSLIIFSLLIILGTAFIWGGYDDASKRLKTVSQINKAEFLAARKSIWQGTIAMSKANFITGTGLGTFVWAFSVYRPENLVNIRAHYAHNDYLHLMAEMGMAALPLMLWIIWVIVSKGLRSGHSTQLTFGLRDGVILGAVVGVISLSLHGLVDFNFHIPANMLVMACLAGIIMKRQKNYSDL